MEYVEIALITVAVLVFAFQEYSLDFGALTTGPSYIAFFLCVAVHSFIFLEVADLEFYPYKTLRLNSLNKLLYKVLLCFSLLTFAVLSLLGHFLPIEFFYENLFIMILQHVAVITVKMLFALYPFQLISLADLRVCRLSLRTVLVGLRLIDREDKKVDRASLVSKYLKWFIVGLNSYNRYLYKRRPKHMGIVGINDHYRNVHCVGLIGNLAERAIIARQVRCTLDSIKGNFRRGDLRQLLIALKNIENIEDEDSYPISELSRMVRLLSFSEKAKERLGSPWFIAIVSGITIILGILPLVLK
jgi:hypothetical protein